jgi:tRNA pseudouridine55 synthase
MARRPAPPIDGVCVVDKPAGWTSHDVVAKARGILGTRKVGHCGTLDPDATGVLVLGVGRATRLLRFLSDSSKAYVGEVVLGTTTSTLDASGTVTGTFDMAGVTVEQVRDAAGRFIGEIDQIPPMVSAVKVDGRRLHELAREGVEIERRPRRVRIDGIEVEATDDPAVFRVEVRCGSGTYIRSLAADLGAALGGGAHLCNLRRTAVGAFTLAGAHGLDGLELLPMRAVLPHLARVELDEDGVRAVVQGKRIAADTGTDALRAAYGPDGDLVAVLEPAGSQLRPLVVVAPQPGG